MTRILGLAGSLRRKSFNAGLLRAAGELMPAGADLVAGSIREVPLYDGDAEAATGIPPAVRTLKEQLGEADGLLLVTPEYNNSIPGVFKNAIDWMTRPAADIPRLFYGRPVAIVGATPGGWGTTQAQTAWLPVLRTLRMRPWFEGRIMVARAREHFDDDSNLIDEATRGQLAEFLAGFVAFAGRK